MSGRIMLDSDPPQEEPPVPAIPPTPPPESTPPETPPAAEPTPAKEAGEAKADGEPQLPADMQKRWDRLTWEKYDYKRRAEEAERQIHAWQEQQRRAQQPQQGQDVRDQALQQFRAEQAEREFNAACNATFQKGAAEYPDFGDAVRALNAVGYGSRPDALAAISAMPDGHHIYKELAQDLDNAARVLSLPPMHMAMELARMAHARGNGAAPAAAPAEPPPAVTRAPAPLRPVGGNSARPERPLDQVSIGEFIRRRDRDTIGSSRIRR